jgi:hypothetical protein
MVGASGAQTAQAVSHYRAARHLRNGGLHKALNLGPDDELTDEHLQKGLDSKNGHVQAMADLAKRCKDEAKKAKKAE